MFETSAQAKVILAGEHSVLRGCSAIVVPLRAKTLKLSYIENEQPLSVDYSGTSDIDSTSIFFDVIKSALRLIGKKERDLRGNVRVENSIPVGAGLGASAALCVSIGRLFEYRKWVQREELQAFCKEIEHYFHGESSGLDVASALSNRVLKYKRGLLPVELEVRNYPLLFVSYSGDRGATSECVAQVKSIIQERPGEGLEIDAKMGMSVELIENGLMEKKGASYAQLKEAIDLGRDCFDKWGLLTPGLTRHMELLKKAGASAVKPTGSGKGGFVLSLWETEPYPARGASGSVDPAATESASTRAAAGGDLNLDVLQLTRIEL